MGVWDKVTSYMGVWDKVTSYTGVCDKVTSSVGVYDNADLPLTGRRDWVFRDELRNQAYGFGNFSFFRH